MKSIVKKIIVSFLALSLISSFYKMNDVKAASTVYYTAIGDSITAAEDSYVYQVKNYLGNRYGYCEAINMSINGATSGDFLSALTDATNPYYFPIRTVLKLSNYITFDLGSNDFINGALDIYAKNFGCTQDEMWDKFNTLYTNSQSSNKKLAQSSLQELQRISDGVHKDFYENNAMDAVYNQYRTNFIKIIKEIKKISPNAKIYVGNLYNPFVGADPICLGNVDLNAIAEKYLTLSNKMISANANGCKVVDLYKLFRSDKYLKSDYKQGITDPHPNTAGQKLIANQFINVMKQN